MAFNNAADAVKSGVIALSENNTQQVMDVLKEALLGANQTSAPRKETPGPHHFVHQTLLEPADLYCFGIVATLFLSYTGIYMWFNRSYPYASMSSHVELQRVQWTKHVFSASKHRMNVIQCFRSGLMIISFYLDSCVTAAVAISKPIFTVWTSPAVLRSAVPMFLLFAAIVNFFIVGMGHYYLHFHTQVEEGAGASDLTRARSKSYGVVLGSAAKKTAVDRQMDEMTMKITKQRSAAMILQSEWHFRYGWRLLSMGLVTMLWVMSPYAMLAAALILVVNLLYNDFPFPEELQKRHSALAHGDAPSTETGSPSAPHAGYTASFNVKPAFMAITAATSSEDAQRSFGTFGALESGDAARFVAVTNRRTVEPVELLRANPK